MRRSPHTGAAAGALSLALLLGAGAAQAGPIAEPSLSLALDSAFDSNVFNGRGPDLVNRITPHASLELRDRRFDLKLGYDLGFWVYTTGTAENSINHRAVGTYEGRITRRLTLRLGDEFIYAQDPGFILRAGVIAPQTSILDNTADGAIAYRITRRLDGELDYTYRHTTFGAPPPGDLTPLYDGDQHDGTASLTFRAGRLDDVRLSHRFSYFTADGTNLAIENAPALGWRHQLLRDLELRIEGGPVVYQLLDASRSITAPINNGCTARNDCLPGSGVSWRGATLLRFYTPHWRSSIAFTRDFIGGTGAGAVLWADYVTLQGGYHLERKLDVRAGAGYFANGLAPNGSRLFDGVTVDAMLDWAIVPELHFAAYYSFRWQEAFAAPGTPEAAIAPLPDVTRHVVGLRLVGIYGAEARPPRHVPGG